MCLASCLASLEVFRGLRPTYGTSRCRTEAMYFDPESLVAGFSPRAVSRPDSGLSTTRPALVPTYGMPSILVTVHQGRTFCGVP